MADREGRLEDRPARIKIQILPYDNCNLDELLNELADAGFIVRYMVDGHNYIEIPTFLKHQRPHYKEMPSTIPSITQAQTNDDSSIKQEQVKHDSTLPPLTLNPYTLTLNPSLDSSKGRTKNVDDTPYENIMQSWNDICGIWVPQINKIEGERKKHVRARYKELGSTEAVIEMFKRMAGSDYLMGRKTDWACSFDWVMGSPNNVNKVLDGNYDNRKQANQARAAPAQAEWKPPVIL